MEKYMQTALHLAEEALYKGELPIASVLVLDDKIISEGYTSEVNDKRFLVHAELKTLLEADFQKLKYKDRQRCHLFTTLEPCMMCLGACMTFFLGRITYALESPGDGATQMALENFHKDNDFPGYDLPIIKGGVLRSESINLFKTYVDRHNSGAMWEWAKSLAAL